MTTVSEPLFNPNLFGHEAAEQAFLTAYQGGKLPHAWLISGIKGIGKATLAFRIMRYLLSGAKAEAEGDSLFGPAPTPSLALPEQHPIFSRLAAGAHSDLKIIRNEDEEGAPREITVEEIRQLQPFFALSSGETGWRIVVIDGAESMNRNAQNALLKILEEPPADALILLISHNPGQMLPTIRSRCRALKLTPLNAPTLARALDAPVDEALHALCGGSPGIALSLQALDLETVTGQLETLLDTPEKATEISEKLTRKGTEAHWRSYLLLLSGIVAHRIKNAALHKAPIEPHLLQWQRVGQLQSETEGLNMDKKIALMSLSA